MSGYLTHSVSSTGSRTTFTISAWVKINGTTTNQTIFGAGTAGTNSGKFYFAISNGQVRIGGGANVYRVTGRKLRDPASWYHLVCAFDTTQGSDGNRIKFYINGLQETDFSGGYNTISSSQNTPVNESGKINTFGAEQGGGESWDGSMTHMVLVDGAQLTASNFGETDSTTGEWKPKADPTGVTYGTNGVFMKCENSGNFGLDSSGQGNNYTSNSFPTGAHSKDTASNNFCTFNPLSKASNVTLSEANLKATIAGAGQSRSTVGTMAVSKGKWYWEVKYTTDQVSAFIGLISADIAWNINSTTYPSSGVSDNVGFNDGGTKYVNGSSSSYGSGFGNNDVIGVAANLDDNEVIFYVNGTAQNSGTAISKTFSGDYLPVVQHQSSSGTSNFQINFGNPSFTISSGNADAAGHGNFEYAVPSGHFALCTKNLNTYG